MPVDPSIALQVQPMESPIKQASEALTLKHLSDENAMQPLKMQAAQMDIQQKQKEMQTQDAIKKSFVFDDVSGKLDKIKSLNNLYKADPQYAADWGEKQWKTDQEFQKNLQDKHKNFVETAGPIAASAVARYDELIAKGMPKESAWQQVMPLVQGGMGHLKSLYPDEIQGDGSQFTPDGLRQFAMQWPKYAEKNLPPSQYEQKRLEMDDRKTDVMERRLTDQENKADKPDTGWQFMKDKDDNVLRASPNKGIVQKQNDDGTWEDVKAPKGMVPPGKGGTGAQSGREAVFTQRVITSANEAAKDLGNIVRMPMSSSRGIFGGRSQGHGIMEAGKESLANELSSQEVQSYNVRAAGIQRSLAAIEASGLAPSGSLSHQMDAVTFKAGDTNRTKLEKLAQTRQIVEAGMEAVMQNPRVSESEKGLVNDLLGNIRKSVPFTIEDIDKLETLQENDPKASLKDVIKNVSRETEKNIPKANDKGWTLHEDAKGNKAYVSPDGKQFEELK